jgi:hypothetical protein
MRCDEVMVVYSIERANDTISYVALSNSYGDYWGLAIGD